MEKLFKFVVWAGVLIASCISQTHAQPIACYRSDGAITIDGIVDAQWDDTQWVTFSGANDNTTQVGYRWDDTYLYVAFRVTDANLWADTKSFAWETWRNDAVEMYYDADNDGGVFAQATDHLFHVDLLGESGGEHGDGTGGFNSGWGPGAAVWHYAVTGSLNDDSGNTDAGYTYEIALDWDSIGVGAVGNARGGAHPVYGQTAGIAAGSTDDDDGGDASEGWAGFSGVDPQVPDQYLDLVFRGLPDGEPVVVYAAQSAITVDGVIDAQWDGTQWVSFSGPNENQTQVGLRWDANYLYVAYRVSDDHLWSDAKVNPWETWRNDSIEFYYDADADGGQYVQNSDHTFHIDLSQEFGGEFGDGTAGYNSGWGPNAGLWGVALDGTLNDDSGSTDTGYTFEIALDWPSIGAGALGGARGGVAPAIDQLAAFALGMVDDEDGGDTAEGWAGYTGADPQIPETYLNAIFKGLPPQGPIDALRTVLPITVDGVIDSQWDQTDWVTYAGPNDNTTQVGFRWDNNYLYVAFQVSDPNAWGDAKINAWETWRNDGVEVYFDADGDGGEHVQSTDHAFHADLLEEIGGEFGDGTAGFNSGWGPAAAQWKSLVSGSLNDDATTDTGYAYEIALDWASIGVGADGAGRAGMAPSVNQVAGIAVGVTDDDDGGDANEGWAGFSSVDPQIPSTFAQLTFKAAPQATLIKAARMPRSVTIDGVIDSQWDATEWIDFDGPNDNATRVGFRWDADYLYVAFQVDDANLMASEKMFAWETWRNDSVEIYFDADNDGGAFPTAADHFLHVDFLNLMIPDAVTNGGEYGDGTSGYTIGWGPQGAIWMASAQGSINNNSDVDTGYSYEVAIDWPSIGVGAVGAGAAGVAPSVGQIAGITIGVCDDDNGGAGNEGWAGLPGTDAQVPDSYYDIQFDAVPAELNAASHWSLFN